MKSRIQCAVFRNTLAALFVVLWTTVAAAAPVEFHDARGETVRLEQPPSRVVSLIPGITETIVALGAADALAGITYHSADLPGLEDKRLVGGFFSPWVDVITDLKPDLVFISGLHEEVRERLAGSTRIVELPFPSSLDGTYERIELLGKIFDRSERADSIVAEMRETAELIALKVEKIPPSERKRVMRLMGRDSVMTPGDDSFQNAFIRAAGGIPPELGKSGPVVPVTLEEWKAYNPQVIYGCGGDRKAVDRLLQRPGWRDVDAVRDGRILMFPCQLTCRASVHSAYFIAWLASSVNGEYFGKVENQVHENGPLGEESVIVDLEYVEDAAVHRTRIADFVQKTLVVDLKEPMRVLSTLEGWRDSVRCVGNHYTPPPFWGLSHQMTLPVLRENVLGAIGRSPEEASLLYTGANMDHLSVQKVDFKEMTVYALVTAGVRSNAMRTSVDTGDWYELQDPGTINILVLSNMRLSPRAMTRAIICATEAKTAALMDLDIRSSVQPLTFQATGTGTDNVLVVEGRGPEVDCTGGHCKAGELIARAVYAGVTDAIRKQNRIRSPRTVLLRLQERGLDPYGLACQPCLGDASQVAEAHRELQRLLLVPRYAALVESALALDDAHERGLIVDLGAFESSCRLVAEEIAGDLAGPNSGNTGVEWKDLVAEDVPLALEMALNGLLNGVRNGTANTH